MTNRYETPTLTVHGALESLTQGTQNGQSTDALFASDTPRGQLTFS